MHELIWHSQKNTASPAIYDPYVTPQQGMYWKTLRMLIQYELFQHHHSLNVHKLKTPLFLPLDQPVGISTVAVHLLKCLSPSTVLKGLTSQFGYIPVWIQIPLLGQTTAVNSAPVCANM